MTPGLEQRLARGGEPVRVRAEEVDAGEAVHLEVDEPGRGDAAAVRAVEADRLDPVAVERDVAGDEAPVDECCLDAEPHVPIAFRTTPSAAARRSRAVVDVDTRAKADDCDLRVPVRALESVVDVCLGARRWRARRSSAAAP